MPPPKKYLYPGSLVVKIELSRTTTRRLWRTIGNQSKNLAYQFTKAIIENSIPCRILSASWDPFGGEKITAEVFPNTKYPVNLLRPMFQVDGEWVGDCFRVKTHGQVCAIYKARDRNWKGIQLVTRRFDNGDYGVWRCDHNQHLPRKTRIKNGEKSSIRTRFRFHRLILKGIVGQGVWLLMTAMPLFAQNPCSMISWAAVDWGDGERDTFWTRPAQWPPSHTYHRWGVYRVLFHLQPSIEWCCEIRDTVWIRRLPNEICDDHDFCTWDKCYKGECVHNRAYQGTPEYSEWLKQCGCCRSR